MSAILEVPSGYWAIAIAIVSGGVIVVEKFGAMLTWFGVRPAKETELKSLAVQNEDDHRRMRETVAALRTDNEAAHREFRIDNETGHREMRDELREIGKGLTEIGKGLARVEGRLERK